MTLANVVRSLKIASILMAVVGAVLVFGAVGTFDYYTLELGQEAPLDAYQSLRTGIVMMIPTIVCLIKNIIKEHDKNVF